MNRSEANEPAGPEIIENYRNFNPPAQFRKLVEELLGSVPANYLNGLKRIVLTNRAALARNQRRQKIWRRGSKYRLAEARGAYYQATKSSPAAVWLYVDNILKKTPAWMLRIPLVRYADLGEVLFHEIGHHIHAVHIPVHGEKETVAEDWSGELTRQFFRKHYWYLIPFRYPVSLLARSAQRLFPALRP